MRTELDVVVHAWDPSVWRAEAGLQDCSSSLNYIARPHLKKTPKSPVFGC